MASRAEAPVYLPNGSLMRAFFTITDYPFSDNELSQSLTQTYAILEPQGIFRPNQDEDTSNNFNFWSSNGFLLNLGTDHHEPSEGDFWYMPEQTRLGFNRDEETGVYFGRLSSDLRVRIKDILSEQAYNIHLKSITSSPAFSEYVELYKKVLSLQRELFYPADFKFHRFSPLHPKFLSE